MKAHPFLASAMVLLCVAASALAYFAISSLTGVYYVDGLRIRSLGEDVEPAVESVHHVISWTCVAFSGILVLCATLIIVETTIGRWWFALPVISIPMGALIGYLDLAVLNCGYYVDVSQCVG